jgi:hypothetical protein
MVSKYKSADFSAKQDKLTINEAFMIIPVTKDKFGNPDNSGAYVLRHLGALSWNVYYTHQRVGQNRNPLGSSDDMIDAQDPTDYFNQFYIQKTSAPGRFFFVNRQYCTAIGITSDYGSKTTPFRGITELMTIEKLFMNNLPSGWDKLPVTPLTIPASNLYNRCGFKTLWRDSQYDYTTNVNKIRNKGKFSFYLQLKFLPI